MLEKKNDVKALVLLAASKLSAKVPAENLFGLVLETGFVTFDTLTDAFEELFAAGMLENAEADGKKVCALSEKGREILPEITSMLPPSLADEAVRDILRRYDAEQSGIRYVSKIEREGDVFMLVAGAYAETGAITEVRMRFDSEHDAIVAKMNFESKPEKVIGVVTAAVTGDINYML